MKSVLSYVLFGNNYRYWGNIPYLLVANSAIYPEFYMRFFVHADATACSGFSVLQEVAKINDKIEIEIIDEPYQDTQPTTWRMKPLWDENVDLLLCRDLDYGILRIERESVEYFMKQDESVVHGIRSYHLHTAPYMAGLCGFKTEEVLKIVKSKSPDFESYLDWGRENVDYCSNWRWGCDQALLRDFFRACKLYPLSMDCPQMTAPNTISYFNANLVHEDTYKGIALSNCNEQALDFSSSINAEFTGGFWACSVNNLRTLCDIINNSTSQLIKDISC